MKVIEISENSSQRNVTTGAEELKLSSYPSLAHIFAFVTDMFFLKTPFFINHSKHRILVFKFGMFLIQFFPSNFVKHL